MSDADGLPLLQAIRSQAEAERERILAEGRARAEEVRARGREQVRGREEEALRALERRLAVERERILGESRLEERADLLGVRREWIQRAFRLAGRLLAERCATPAYEGLLAALLREAAAALGGTGELRVAEADLELARRLARGLGRAHEVRAEGREPGTALAVSGGRRVDNSLATRLEQAAGSMERDIARLLFAEPGAEHG